MSKISSQESLHLEDAAGAVSYRATVALDLSLVAQHSVGLNFIAK